MKKEAIITAVLFSAVLVGTIFYFSKYASSDKDLSIYHGLPGETLMAVNTYSSAELGEVFKKNALISDLSNDPFFENLQLEFETIEELMGTGEENESQYELIWVLARVNREQMGLLLLVNNLKYSDLTKWVDAKGATLTVQKDEIGSLAFGDKTLACYSIGNILALSAHPILLEGSRENLLAEHSMLEIPATNDKELSVWLNFDVLHWLLPKISEEVGAKLFSLTNEYKGVGLYKVSINENEFNFYGNVKSSGLNSAFNPVLFGKPAAISSLQILPEVTSFFLSKIAWSAENAFRSALLDTVFKAKADSIAAEIKLDLLSNYCVHLDEEFTFGVLQAYNQHIEGASFLASKVKDFKGLQDALAGLDTSNWQMESDSFVIKRIQNGAFLNSIYGDMANSFNQPYYVFIDAYIVFANQITVLQQIIRAQKDGKTMAKSLNYGEVADWISTECNLVMYVNPNKAYNIPRDVLSQEMSELYNRNLGLVKSIDHFVFQLVKTGDHFYNHIYGKTSKSLQEESNVLFTRVFESEIVNGPFLVTNYHTKTKEIMVVDANGTAHQINKANEVVWSYKMNEKLVGKPFELDLFKNGKLQYFIASKKHLHIVDRTGAVVSAYPITLAANISGSAAVFDFKNTKDYQIYVPCKGKKIYAYSAKGQPIGAWNPISLDANPVGELQYFNKGGINYCFISDQKGNIYVWNEAGKKALEPIKTGLSFASNFTLQFGTQLSDCKLLGVDSTGNYIVAALNGSIKKTAIGTAFTAPEAFWWQTNEDASKELVIWQNSLVAIYDQSLKMLVKIALTDQIAQVEVLSPEKEKEILAIQTKAGKIFLYSIQGELLNTEAFDGFGARMAIYDIDQDGKQELITTLKNELIIYKNVY